MLVSHHYKISAYYEELATPEYEFKTLVHEFGHSFYAPDHYEDDYTTADAEEEYGYDFDDICIYGGGKDTDSARVQLPICQGCRTIIENNADRYTLTTDTTP